MREPSFFATAGEWAAGLTLEDIPEQARVALEHAVIDLTGVSIAGSEHDLAGLIAGYLDESSLGASDACTLIRDTRRAGVEGATLFNAVVGHVLDFDDSSDTLGGHPTVVILPALLALAEANDLTGREVLTALAAGIEVAAHVGRQVNIAHYERGWHPTATLGIFGTAAASAKLLGLDAEGITAALAIVSAAPSGMRAHFGTHMKSVQVGEAAVSGVTAALLSAAGIRGNVNAFEHEQGFGAIYNGESGFRHLPLDASASRTWELIDPGLTIKQYPCCASAHPAIDAALDLRPRIPSGVSIERVRIRLHPRRLRHTDNPRPQTPLEGKFSVQYLVANALVTGSVTLADFTEEALGRGTVRELLERVEAEAFPPEEYGPDHYAGEVQLTLGDGTVVERRVSRARGRGSRVALSDAEIVAKFTACSEPVVGPERATAILRTLRDFTGSRIRDVMGQLGR